MLSYFNGKARGYLFHILLSAIVCNSSSQWYLVRQENSGKIAGLGYVRIVRMSAHRQFFAKGGGTDILTVILGNLFMIYL